MTESAKVCYMYTNCDDFVNIVLVLYQLLQLCTLVVQCIHGECSVVYGGKFSQEKKIV